MVKEQNTSCSKLSDQELSVGHLMFQLSDQELSVGFSIKRCSTVPRGIQGSSVSKPTWVKEDNNQRADVWLLWVTTRLLIKHSVSVEIYMEGFSPTTSSIYLNHPKHKALVIHSYAEMMTNTTREGLFALWKSGRGRTGKKTHPSQVNCSCLTARMR